MKRKKDIMSFFQRKDKVGSETEPDGSGVERARESRESAEREQEELSIGETESEGIVEEESETDGETEAESDTPTEEPCVSTSSGPSDISKSREEPPVQPMMNIYPRTLMGDRRRSFKAAWYHIHPWLEYSKQSDSVFCYACRHFSPPKVSETVFDSKLGFNNWKKAPYKQGDLQFMQGLSGTNKQ
ncbi:uncharacterized protein [Chanodichthys erythropterus]|uniref:uncharacterized protein isoform X2 n=1 Tax=Chanodichthys erythropterus TaxID=933992 RepID=UPI00351E0F44